MLMKNRAAYSYVKSIIITYKYFSYIDITSYQFLCYCLFYIISLRQYYFSDIFIKLIISMLTQDMCYYKLNWPYRTNVT